MWLYIFLFLKYLAEIIKIPEITETTETETTEITEIRDILKITEITLFAQLHNPNKLEPCFADCLSYFVLNYCFCWNNV